MCYINSWLILFYFTYFPVYAMLQTAPKVIFFKHRFECITMSVPTAYRLNRNALDWQHKCLTIFPTITFKFSFNSLQFHDHLDWCTHPTTSVYTCILALNYLQHSYKSHDTLTIKSQWSHYSCYIVPTLFCLCTCYSSCRNYSSLLNNCYSSFK